MHTHLHIHFGGERGENERKKTDLVIAMISAVISRNTFTFYFALIMHYCENKSKMRKKIKRELNNVIVKNRGRARVPSVFIPLYCLKI